MHSFAVTVYLSFCVNAWLSFVSHFCSLVNHFSRFVTFNFPWVAFLVHFLVFPSAPPFSNISFPIKSFLTVARSSSDNIDIGLLCDFALSASQPIRLQKYSSANCRSPLCQNSLPKMYSETIEFFPPLNHWRMIKWRIKRKYVIKGFCSCKVILHNIAESALLTSTIGAKLW